MFRNFDLSKSAKYLFAVALALLVITIIVEQYISSEKPELRKKQITFNEADSLFRQALKNFDINEQYLTIKRNKKNPADSIYSVKVYSDVPVSLLLLELENLFSPTLAKILSQEESIGGKTITKINVDDNTLITSEFIPDKNISREKGRIGFVVFNLDYSVDNTAIMNTPEQIIFMMIPSAESKKFSSAVLSAGKRYALLINDDVRDLNYRMNESYPTRRNKKSIENIFKNFPSAAFIAIDDNSDLFESATGEFIIRELDWRKAFYVKLSRFNLLESYSSNVTNAFEAMIRTMKKNESRIILIDSKNFTELLPLIPAYRKIGFKFVSATELLK